MTGSSSESWTGRLSGRERVRKVMEQVEEPTSIQEIADRAAVSRTIADDELYGLHRDDWITETTVDGMKAYDQNYVRKLVHEVTSLIETVPREKLERQLASLKEEQECLATEYDVSSLDEFRETLATEDLSADAVRERRNVIATWEAIDTDLELVTHALQLYDAVIERSSSRAESPAMLD